MGCNAQHGSVSQERKASLSLRRWEGLRMAKGLRSMNHGLGTAKLTKESGPSDGKRCRPTKREE